MCKRVMLTLIGIFLLLPSAHAVILNGDFEITPGTGLDPFADWTTFGADGIFAFNERPTVGADGDGNFVEMSATVLFGVGIEQTFNLPDDTQSVSFDYFLETAGMPTGDPPDNFQATQFDFFFNPAGSKYSAESQLRCGTRFA